MRPSSRLFAVLAVFAAACGSAPDAVVDAGTTTSTDAGTTTVTDAGTVADAGTVEDAGTTEVDAGTTVPDAGEPPFTFAPDVDGHTLMPAFSGTCWLRTDGTIACAGAGVGSVLRDLPDAYTDVSADGAYQRCAVKADGTVHCALAQDVVDTTPTTPGFARVAAGTDHACAINAARGLRCWSYGQATGDAVVAETPATGEAVDVASTMGTACAAFKDGSAKCWGGVDFDFGTDRWVRVFAYGGGWLCAIRDTGTAACSDGRIPFPNDRVTHLAGNYTGICGLRKDGTIVCNQAALPAPSGKFTEIQTGYRNVCARREGTGVVECFGPNNLSYPAAAPFVGVPSQVLVANSGLVLRSSTGTTWTSDVNTYVFSTLPTDASSLTAISTGGTTACGLTSAGGLKCWGALDDGAQVPVETGFKSVEAIGGGGCAIDATDSVKCWGPPAAFPPPAGAAVQVCSTTDGGCVRKADGSVKCWGYEISSPPETDRFLSISCESSIACGVLTSGSIKCWAERGVGCAGCNSLADTAPTTGTYTDVVLNGNVACARRSDASLACWGDARVSTPPTGAFDKVWVGNARACGLRSGGSALLCWGEDAYASQ